MKSLNMPLESLLRRLAETPATFLSSPGATGEGSVHTAALLGDLLWERGEPGLEADEAEVFSSKSGATPRLIQLYQVIFWFLSDEAFTEVPDLKTKVLDLATMPNPQKPDQTFLAALTRIIPPEKFKTDPDRREELARLILKVCDVLPDGETEPRFHDRWKTVDSLERLRVVEETRAAAQRARELAEALARQEAEEAASKYQRD